MPYISPALSPTKQFRSISSYPSPPGSTPSSPGSSIGSVQTSPTTSTAPSSMTSLHSAGGGVQFDQSYEQGFPRRPTSQRHHSRSHSSDALSTLNGGYQGRSSSYNYGAVKSTPDFVFVQHPASPAAVERSDPYSSQPTSPTMSSNGSSYSRPSFRHSASSRTSTSSASTVTPADVGDVAPPRSSSRRRKFHISASADSSPRMSMSLEHGQAFSLPLPDLDAMSPPACSNRRTSVGSILPEEFDEGETTPQANGYHHEEESSESPLALKSTDLPPHDSALATSSESNSSGSVSDSNSSDEGDRTIEQDPALLLLSQQVLPQRKQQSRASWGDLPTPTMGSQTSFSFAGGSASTSSSTPTAGTSTTTQPPPHSVSAVVDENVQASSSSSSGLGSGKFRRPGPSKAQSERNPSPFRLDIDTAQRERRREFSEGSNNPWHRPSPLPTPMLRKKSGELVKSSMKHDARAKSAPSTPTGAKAVHFDEQLERVKLFLAQQKPTAVSRDGSPIETETEDDSEAAFPFPPMTTSIPAQITLVLPDFPGNVLPEIGHRDVSLETLEVAADSKSLKGTVQLRNIAFEKRLSIRFTFDEWQTVSEVTGEWQSTLVGGWGDRWSFSIKLQDMLARIEEKKMFIALKYTVDGREIWDNNWGNNYRAEFKKQAARSQAVVGGARAARHEWAVTNPGQASERMADLRRELDRLVADHDDFGSADELVLAANAQKGVRYQPRFVGGEAVPLAQAPSSSTFSARYDFGASLKTAVTHRSSPQSSHAILDNPYFASPRSNDASLPSWTGAATMMSPPQAATSSLPGVQSSPPRSSFAALSGGAMTPSIIGGVHGTTWIEPSTATTPPASFSGHSYYARNENNGVVSPEFGLSNYLSMGVAKAPPSPPQDYAVALQKLQQSYFPLTDSSSDEKAELIGGAPLARHGQSVASSSSLPASTGSMTKSQIMTSPAARFASQESLLEPSLDAHDPLDRSLYSPAMSPPSLSPPRRQSPPPRPISPDDLLSPAHSSASTDTSISTPQSPGGSPPLKMYAPYGAGASERPDMASDTYFNFIHRYCWGNGDNNSAASDASSTTSSTGTALGLAGMTANEAPTPRRATPASSCSASLLSSPSMSRSGSQTPSPANGSPTLENVARMETNGYMQGPPTVEI